MTKIYSTNALNSERDNKEVGTLHREYVMFRQQFPERISDKGEDSGLVTYNDEQIPIDTRYKQTEVGFEYVPRWSGGIVSQKWISIVGAQLSAFFGGDKKEFQKTGEVESGGKVWASQKDYRVTMLDFAPKGLIPTEDRGEYDWMWNVFDKKHNFKDIGRKITIDWGSEWGKVMGSLSSRKMLEEEFRFMSLKFFPDKDSVKESLDNGRWHDVVLSYVNYFTGIGKLHEEEEAIMKSRGDKVKEHTGVVRDFMKMYTDKLTVEEATSVALLALCEFAESNPDLKASFGTSAYRRVHTAYRTALEEWFEEKKTSRQKSSDRRVLNDFIKDIRSKMEEVTFEDISEGLGWGQNRVNSTMRLFDHNIGSYRPMNDEELLYTVMDNHLTDRQAQIIEMNYGLSGNKISIDLIAEELRVNEKTVRRDRAKALEIIEKELSFKFS